MDHKVVFSHKSDSIFTNVCFVCPSVSLSVCQQNPSTLSLFALLLSHFGLLLHTPTKKSRHFVEFHLIVQNLTLIHCNVIDYIQTKFIEYILVLADNTTSLFHQSDPSLHIYIVLMLSFELLNEILQSVNFFCWRVYKGYNNNFLTLWWNRKKFHVKVVCIWILSNNLIKLPEKYQRQ